MKHFTILSILTTIALATTGANAEDEKPLFSEVTVTFQNGEEEPVVASAIVNLADVLQLPLFMEIDHYWVVEIDTFSNKQADWSGMMVEVLDPSRLTPDRTSVRPFTLFQGVPRMDWKKGGEATLFKSGSTSLKLKIEPAPEKE